MSDIDWQEVRKEVINNLHFPVATADTRLQDYTWPIFGLMVEKAEEMGWVFVINNRILYFEKPAWGRYSQLPDCTKKFNIRTYGHIKACALAFNEIFKEAK